MRWLRAAITTRRYELHPAQPLFFCCDYPCSRLEQEVPLEAPRPTIAIVLVEHERLRVANRELERRVHGDAIRHEQVIARIDRNVMHYAEPVGEVVLPAHYVGRRPADRTLPAIAHRNTTAPIDRHRAVIIALALGA